MLKIKLGIERTRHEGFTKIQGHAFRVIAEIVERKNSRGIGIVEIFQCRGLPRGMCRHHIINIFRLFYTKDFIGNQ